MPEHILGPNDVASLKELSAAQREHTVAMRELQATIKQVADEAPGKAKDVMDHGTLSGAALLLAYFILSAALAYVKQLLAERNQDKKP